MADLAARALDGRTCGGWLIAGHSMGAKMALVLARRAEDGDPQLVGLRGLILIAGSPPSPEPMDERKRNDMVASVAGDAATRRAFAERFIADNVGAPLDPSLQARAIEDVLRGNPDAWAAWLQGGSREDWCEKIGVLRTPALILSGARDADLGPHGQDTLMAPHLACRTHVVLDGAGHLLPLERPDDVAKHIVAMMARSTSIRAPAPDIAPDYRALIASDRVNARLRSALTERAKPDDPAYNPKALDAVELAILRAVCGRVLPQPGDATIDIAARIDTRLASGAGDGWRFAELPGDAQAYRRALRTLDRLSRLADGGSFVTRGEPAQDALLKRLQGGLDANLEASPGDICGLDAKAMALWFEDLRADAVRTFLAHPAALGRLGFSGIGAGGDDPAAIDGFHAIGIGDRETWEPAAAGAL